MGRKLPAEIRLATGYQLWRANQCGLLRAEPYSSADLKAMLDDDLAARGIERYPKPGEPLPQRRWAPGERPR